MPRVLWCGDTFGTIRRLVHSESMDGSTSRKELHQVVIQLFVFPIDPFLNMRYQGMNPAVSLGIIPPILPFSAQVLPIGFLGIHKHLRRILFLSLVEVVRRIR